VTACHACSAHLSGHVPNSSGNRQQRQHGRHDLPAPAGDAAQLGGLKQKLHSTTVRGLHVLEMLRPVHGAALTVLDWWWQQATFWWARSARLVLLGSDHLQPTLLDHMLGCLCSCLDPGTGSEPLRARCSTPATKWAMLHRSIDGGYSVCRCRHKGATPIIITIPKVCAYQKENRDNGKSAIKEQHPWRTLQNQHAYPLRHWVFVCFESFFDACEQFSAAGFATTPCITGGYDCAYPLSCLATSYAMTLNAVTAT
jgi:hypothetical protein